MYRLLISISVVLIVLVTNVTYCCAESDGLTKEPLAIKSPSELLIIYYSRSGTTRTIAQELARNLSCEIEEIISRKNRQFFGIITCVNDQLFDRDDNIEPFKKDISAYNPLIIASPVWIHGISSPMRTFLKYSGLKGKDAYLVLTNNGNYDDEDENKIINSVESYGITVKGCYRVCTKGKSENELRQYARSFIKGMCLALNK